MPCMRAYTARAAALGSTDAGSSPSGWSRPTRRPIASRSFVVGRRDRGTDRPLELGPFAEGGSLQFGG